MSDINKTARQYFDNYPGVNTFLVTSDGQFFTDENRNAAYDHQSRIKQGVKPNVIRRGNLEASSENHSKSETPDSSWTVKDLKAWMDDNQVEYVTSDKKDVLLEKIANKDNPPVDPDPITEENPETTQAPEEGSDNTEPAKE